MSKPIVRHHYLVPAVSADGQCLGCGKLMSVDTAYTTACPTPVSGAGYLNDADDDTAKRE